MYKGAGFRESARLRKRAELQQASGREEFAVGAKEPAVGPEEPAVGPKEIVDIFVKFDKDADGMISRKELTEVLSELGMAKTNVQRLLSAAEVDDNGALDYHEFAAWICGSSDLAKEVSSHLGMLVLQNRDGHSTVRIHPPDRHSASLELPNGTLIRKVRGRGDFWVVKYDGEDWLVKKRHALEDQMPSDMGKYTSVESLRRSLASGDVALVRGSWLLEQAFFGWTVLPRRQELPEEAFYELEELFTCSESGDAKLKDGATIVAISYCWLSADHPDPEGLWLQEYLRLGLEKHYGEYLPEHGLHSWSDTKFWKFKRAPPLAIFMDWISLYQKPRTDGEFAAFRRALADMGLWYANSLTHKWILSVFPPGITAETRPTWNHCAYQDRGWTTFESSVATLITPSAQVQDLGQFPTLAELEEHYPSGRFTGRKRKRFLSSFALRFEQQPLLAPEEFARLLSGKHFSCARKDEDPVNALYAGIFNDIAAMSTLIYTGISLNMSVFETLQHFWNLKRLVLRDCELKAVPECLFRHCGTTLRGLDLRNNSLTTLPDALGELVHMEVIKSEKATEAVRHVRMEQRARRSLHEEGLILPVSMISLPESMGKMVNVKTINLKECSSLTSLPKSTGNMVNVTYINLHGCRSLTTLPESMGNMVNVTNVNLYGCSRLTRLPESPDFAARVKLSILLPLRN